MPIGSTASSMVRCSTPSRLNSSNDKYGLQRHCLLKIKFGDCAKVYCDHPPGAAQDDCVTIAPSKTHIVPPRLAKTVIRHRHGEGISNRAFSLRVDLRPLTRLSTLCAAIAMSALGQKQTSRDVRRMSALPPKADMCSALADVRFVPIADIGSLNRSPRRRSSGMLQKFSIPAFAPFYC